MGASLPVDDVLAPLRAAVRARGAVVLEAPPGAGKTTRVPPALLDVVDGEIVVLEPRRLAARLSARRVAEERGEEVGGVIGYKVRHEEAVSAATRITYVTEGLLVRRLLAAPTLPGVGALVLDEFHERHLDGDLALALAKRLREGARPELKVLAMSATLDGAAVAAYLDAERITSEGRKFPVEIEYAAHDDDRFLEKQVAGAVRRAIAEGPPGDVLVFLPGAAEIARAAGALAELAGQRGLAVLPLHGELDPAAQDRAIKKGDRTKVILATNVAETSVTIDGVTVVVDAGLARIASHSPWTGLPTLKLSKISQASAAQRAGRAGRTAPGRCLRLYTRHDHDGRPTHDAPEVRRLDLAGALLSLHAAGVTDVRAFGWLDAPPEASVAAAEELLTRLGFVDAHGALSELGRRAARFPIHPRLARLMLEAERRGVVADAALAAAILGERDPRTGDARREAKISGPSDVEQVMDLVRDARRRRGEAYGLDPGAVFAIDRAAKQLERIAQGGGPRVSGAAADTALALALLAGFPDRVARRRRVGGRELVLSAGGELEQAPQSIVGGAQLAIVVDAEDRRSGVGGGKPRARMLHAIEPEMLLEIAPERVVDARRLVWDAARERVEVIEETRYDALVLEERRAIAGDADVEEAARIVATQALAAKLETFGDPEALARLRARVTFVATQCPETGLAPLDDAGLRDALARACVGKTSFAELRAAGALDRAIADALPSGGAAALARLAPEHATLASGRRAKISYEDGKPPWLESRMADFFGLAKGPTVAGGKVPVVLHLLAPNHRAVQVTTDLAGFWQRHWPTIRKELARKYPRHPWPEDPTTATPPVAKNR